MVAAEALGAGALAKVVTTARRFGDNLRVLRLYGLKGARGRLIAFAMGARGLPSRFEALRLGAPFVYVYHGRRAAPGQPDLESALEYVRVVGVARAGDQAVRAVGGRR